MLCAAMLPFLGSAAFANAYPDDVATALSCPKVLYLGDQAVVISAPANTPISSKCPVAQPQIKSGAAPSRNTEPGQS
jgi:hypothetical protein